jgi:AmmeMemoRadiSam system protein B
MSEPLQPKLREVSIQSLLHGTQRGLLLSDPLGLTDQGVFIPQNFAPILQLMDGTRNLATLRTGFELRTGIPISESTIRQMLSELDTALLLDNERFHQAAALALQEFRQAPYRPPIMAGKSYPADPEQLRAKLQSYFDSLADETGDALSPTDIRGLICPHIDFDRGGSVYAQVWGKVAPMMERIELVIVLGTDHIGGGERLILTRQHYATPWGVLPTAQEVVDQLVRALGEEVALGDEFHHRSEHSIEAAAVWLHHLLGDRRCELAPILCGSFQSFIEGGTRPYGDEKLSAAIEALKRAMASRETLVVAAADLAHLGPAFGDPVPIGLHERATLRASDEQLIASICAGDAEATFEQVRQEGDRRRICGLPPIYLGLSLLGEAKGYLSGYMQCPADDRGTSVVSICGAVFA